MKTDHVTRRLNQRPETENCSLLQKFNTTYNNDNRVPAHTGIMFEMTALSDIEILTFELDVRLGSNILASKETLTVEVYTTYGSFDAKMDQPDAWQKVADTKLLISEMLDDAGSYNAIIPVAHFQPVVMATSSRRSFYVTTHRVGSLLDNTVYALDKTGELASENEDMQISVGSGFQETSGFSGSVDHTVNPKWAGVVHYRKTARCEDLQQYTTVQFPFLVEQSKLDAKFLLQMTSAILEAVTGIVKENTALQHFVDQEQYGLVQGKGAETFLTELSPDDSSCPEDWTVCPESFVNTMVIYKHGLGLDTNALQYEFYRPSSLELVTDIVRNKMSGAELTYLGLESVAFAFNITFMGKLDRVTLDHEQQEYFTSTTQVFLNNMIENDASAVSNVSFTDMTAKQNLLNDNSTGNNSTTFTFSGIIRGLTVAANKQNFDLILTKSFRDNGHDLYLSMLKGDGLLPTSVTLPAEGTNLFSGAREFSVQVLSYNDNSNLRHENKTSGRANPILVTIISVVVGCFAVVICLFMVGRRRKQALERKQEIEEYRKEMRERRQVARMDKKTAMLEGEKDAKTPGMQLSRNLSEDTWSGSSISSKAAQAKTKFADDHSKQLLTDPPAIEYLPLAPILTSPSYLSFSKNGMQDTTSKLPFENVCVRAQKNDIRELPSLARDTGFLPHKHSEFHVDVQTLPLKSPSLDYFTNVNCGSLNGTASISTKADPWHEAKETDILHFSTPSFQTQTITAIHSIESKHSIPDVEMGSLARNPKISIAARNRSTTESCSGSSEVGEINTVHVTQSNATPRKQPKRSISAGKEEPLLASPRKPIKRSASAGNHKLSLKTPLSVTPRKPPKRSVSAGNHELSLKTPLTGSPRKPPKRSVSGGKHELSLKIPQTVTPRKPPTSSVSAGNHKLSLKTPLSVSPRNPPQRSISSEYHCLNVESKLQPSPKQPASARNLPIHLESKVQSVQRVPKRNLSPQSHRLPKESSLEISHLIPQRPSVSARQNDLLLESKFEASPRMPPKRSISARIHCDSMLKVATRMPPALKISQGKSNLPLKSTLPASPGINVTSGNAISP